MAHQTTAKESVNNMSQDQKNKFYEDKKLQEQINQEFRETLNSHAKHLQIANSEMGVVQKDVAVVKAEIINIKTEVSTIRNDVGWLKSMAEKLDNRAWMALSGIGLMIITQIILAILKK